MSFAKISRRRTFNMFLLWTWTYWCQDPVVASSASSPIYLVNGLEDTRVLVNPLFRWTNCVQLAAAQLQSGSVNICGHQLRAQGDASPLIKQDIKREQEQESHIKPATKQV